MNIKKIFCDIDNVFCDFDAQYVKVNTVRIENASNYEYEKNFVKFVDSNGFVNAPMMPNAKAFFSGLYQICDTLDIDLYLMASDGGMGYLRDKVTSQKRQWLMNNGLWLGESKFILSHGWRGKTEYAKSGNLLIDDVERNIKNFVAAGGSALLYDFRDYEFTLRKIINIA